MNTPFRTAALVGLVAALILPAAASAAPPVPAGHYLLKTREVVENHAGEYDGVISMTVYPDGGIQGTYRLQDEPTIHDVVGSVTPDGNLWLDLGGATGGGEHIYGTFHNGVIQATVNRPGVDLVTFQSTGPAAHL
jgi:hypothetical protein